MYSDLNLKDWPFRTAADPAHAGVWAGRPETRQQIDRLLRKMQLVPKSGLHILWANFGMGKTHTLYYIQHLCQATQGQLIPIYAPMPKRSTGLLELYREIVQRLPYDYLRKQLQKIGSPYKGGLALHPIFQRSPGVV